MNLTTNFWYYTIALTTFVVLKFVHTTLETEDLIFLLAPVNFLVELFTGTSSNWITDQGYFYSSLNIVINKSCSGFNFWLLCFLTLSFLLLAYTKTRNTKTASLFVSFIGAFFLTILVNSCRIYLLILLESLNLKWTQNPVIHEAVGVVTYLTFLIFIYGITQRIVTQYHRYEKPTQS